MTEDFNPLAKAEELADALRPIGLYEERSNWIAEGEQFDEFSEQTGQGGRKILVMEFLVGDLAFSKRIQQPEQVDIDAEFNLMMGGLKTSEFDDTRNEIIRKLQEGINPFEEED